MSVQQETQADRVRRLRIRAWICLGAFMLATFPWVLVIGARGLAAGLMLAGGFVVQAVAAVLALRLKRARGDGGGRASEKPSDESIATAGVGANESGRRDPIAPAVLWRNILVGLVGALAVQVVFLLNEPTMLILQGGTLLLFIVGLIVAERRLRRLRRAANE